MDSIITVQALRCTACGAPLEPTGKVEIVRCGYCGTGQRVADAREFVDYLAQQMASFVRQALPPGVDVSASGAIDPVARHAAFVNVIAPRLSIESDQLRFRCFSLLSNPFVSLLFTPATRLPIADDPKQTALFTAKAQSAGKLAVDESSRALVAQAAGLSGAYGCVLVAGRVLSGDTPEGPFLAAKNFQAAAEAVRGTGRWSALESRFLGLAEVFRGGDRILSKEHKLARDHLGTAETHLKLAKAATTGSIELGFTTSAIDQELAMVRAFRSMAEVVALGDGGAALPSLVFLQRICRVVAVADAHAPKHWGKALGSVRLREDVMAQAATLRAAQIGGGSVRVLSVGSGPLVPFWLGELPYTFETGALWAKRGQAAMEPVLVAATFPAEPSSMIPGNERWVLTDAFGTHSGTSGIGEGYLRLSGQQTKITQTGNLSAIHQNAPLTSIGARKVVAPICGPSDALALLAQYLASQARATPRAAAQLRLSSPRIVDLIYIPATIDRSGPALPWLGPLSPRVLGDPATLASLVS
jgi:hypothetical protein